MIRFPQKLLLPAAARATIARHDQLGQLDRAIAEHQATILAAPAGWGKTTMLAQWAQSSDLPVAWYSLDAADRDPYQLADYLLTAVTPFVPGAADLARRLPHVRPGELPLFLRECAAQIADADQPFALILDDVHLLTDAEADGAPELFASVMNFLATLIDYTRSCHLVLASRTLPKRIPGLIRQAAQQRVAVLDYLALQWSAGDVLRLGESYAISLPETLADNLARRYNGWVVGIVLALDSAARQSQVGGPIELIDDTGQVYAFFVEQIIAPLPPDLQRFLEETSVLEELSAQRCNLLCQRSDSAVLLDELLGRGLFLSRRGGWLSYHSLFRDFLRARLARDAAREREMLERAAELYAGEDELERAVACLCAAGAPGRAGALIRAAVPRYRHRAQQSTLLRCLDTLHAQSDRARNPYGLPADLLLARARLYGDLALWERAYLDLNLAELTGDQDLVWEARILHTDLLAIQGSVDEARATLEGVPPAEELPPRLRQAARYTAGRLAIIGGRMHQAVELLRAALQDSQPAEARPETMAAIYDLLGYGLALSAGPLDAIRALQRAEACWQISGDSGRRALTLNNIAVLALDEGRLADARSALTNALALAQETSRRREEAGVRMSLADLELTEGNLDEAGAQFATAHTLTQQARMANESVSAAAGAALVGALSGDAVAARLWLERLPHRDLLSPDLRGRGALARALLLPRAGQARAAALAEASHDYTSLGRVESAIVELLTADAQLAASPGSEIDWAALDAAAARLPATLRHQILDQLPALRASLPASSALASYLQATIVEPPPARWAISALGRFICLSDGQAVELSPLHRTLLVRMVDVGPGGLAVDQLWEDVWGDSHVSIKTMHKALSRLREQTGLPAASRHGHCSLGVPWEQIAYDVQDFERALADPSGSAALQRAVDRYAGDFLPNAAPTAQAWADARRTYLRQRHLTALDQLAALYEPESPERALGLYQRAFQIDRSREQTASRLMALAARQGNHLLASDTFAQLSEALHNLGLAPLPSTVSLFQHLR